MWEPNWLTDIKSWFQSFMAFFKAVDSTSKKIWEWTVNHVYALVPVVVALAKSIWDFFITLIDRITVALQGFDINSITHSDGMFATALDVLSFVNTFLPLDEMFLWTVSLITLWGVCSLIRLVISAKRLLFG